MNENFIKGFFVIFIWIIINAVNFLIFKKEFNFFENVILLLLLTIYFDH